ncbi:prolactin receptor b [Archocentrus centrarchus]|uniref:prolactin receptor b n=1 Tax=Archocentrus centrarchus TaxID=63155 RepID=UPI0011EA197F|nr:prolactin receptor-like [Archocentrus centrarchus]
MSQSVTARARMVKGPRLASLLLLLTLAAECNCTSPPGKPVLLGCRSPEKETFFCWWNPGSDGGLPTVHHLYYERDDLEGMQQCLDYRTAGSNSCFFNKTYTSIWVDYTVTVVASNALGSTSSEAHRIDVMNIVKPYAPENVTLVVKMEDSPHLSIRWHRPSNTDTRSGWVTVQYQLRIKQENSKNWKNYTSGTQTHFTIYGIDPGVVYIVQVRCALDHGTWSEWSNTTSVKVPNFPHTDSSFWILVFGLSAIPLLAATFILVMKRKHVKQCILPPVPGPKIRGVDVQLLKSGRSDDVINAMFVNQKFPAMIPWTDQKEQYLIVSDKDTSSLPEERKKMFIIPAALILDSEISVKESSEADRFVEDCEFPSEESSSNTEPLQLLPKCPSASLLNGEVANQHKDVTVKTIQPFGNGGYVDIPSPENMEEGNYSRVNEVNGDDVFIKKTENAPHALDIQGQKGGVPEDYSRVKEVNSDKMVFLEKHCDSVNSSVKSKGYIDWVIQNSKNPHMTGPSEGGVGTGLSGCEYVETVPQPAII